MIKALIFKEWLKTSRTFVISLLVSAAVGIYAVMMMSRLVHLKGVDHLLMIMVLKDNTFVDSCTFVALAIGVAMAVAQMWPEMTQKRLKLTLHLPCPTTLIVMTMLMVGLAELLVIFGVQMSIIGIYDSTILPSELVWRVLLTMLPWYFAGFTGYLFVSAVCLEGSWRMRIVLSLLCTAALFVYFLQPAMEAYNGFLPIMIALTVVFMLPVFGSVMRFKEGRVD